MAKIFEYKAGSYIDQVSKTVGTPTNVTHRQTEKGVAGYFNETSYINLTNSVTLGTNDFSLVFNCKPTDFKNSLNVLIRSNTNGLDAFFNIFGNFIISKNGVANIFVSSMTFSKNKFYQIKYIRKNGVSYFYVNNDLISSQTDATDYSTAFTQIGRVSNGFIGYLQSIKIYDHVLSEQERNTLYEQFLQASPTEKPVRGFEYPKPTDLSSEKDAGLVAAYNMIPNGNTLVDISGNGNNGIIVGALRTKDGMKFPNSTNNVTLLTDIPLVSTATICVRLKRLNNDAGYILSSNTSGQRMLHIPSTSNILTLYNDALATLTGFSKVEFSDIVISISGTTANTYYNGSLVGTATLSSSLNTVVRMISSTIADRYWNNEISDLKIYNYAFTPEQAKAYHNSFVQPTLIEDFSSYGVGTTPDKWIPVSGSYKVEESAATGKYLNCVTAGVIAIPSKQAYGTWEFDLYKGGDVNEEAVGFISDRSNFALNNAIAYYFILSGSERVAMGKSAIGSVTYPFYSASSYITPNTWYRARITRTTTGVFTVLIKGGNFTPTAGYDGWTLVSTTGGLGTNPVTDNAYTTSNYLALDLDAGDRISNIKLLDGIIQ